MTTVAAVAVHLTDSEANHLVVGYCDLADDFRDKSPSLAGWYRDLAIALSEAVRDRNASLERMAIDAGELGRLVDPGTDAFADEMVRQQDGEDGENV